MADELAEVGDDTTFKLFPKLEEICLRFIGENGKLWSPEDFAGIPRHLLLHIAEYLHHFDLERLEAAGVFEKLGTCTDFIWRNLYVRRWPRKRKWPDVYFKSKGLPKGKEAWKVQFLQRYFQETINRAESRLVVAGQDKPSNEALQDVASVCGKYVAYLRLYNPACIFLTENMDIFLKFADYVEFLEIFLLRDNGVPSICLLLEILLSKSLKSVGFSFCKVNSIQEWRKLLGLLSRSTSQLENNMTCSVDQTFVIQHNLEPHSLICELQSPASFHKSIAKDCLKSSRDVHVSEFSTELTSFSSESANSVNSTFQDIQDIDIYDFAETSDQCMPVDKNTFPRNTDPRNPPDTGFVNSTDLYDEIFGQCNSMNASPKLSIKDDQRSAYTFSDVHNQRLSVSFFNAASSCSDVSTLGCSLVHFDLVAFWLQRDLFALLVHTLKGWLSLESLTLQDNALGFFYDPSELVETLSLLSTQGRLQSVEITNNPVDDDFAKRLFTKLVSVQCCKCRMSRSLTKLIFSSCKVSRAAAEYFSKGISPICFCGQNKSKTVVLSPQLDIVHHSERLSTSCEVNVGRELGQGVETEGGEFGSMSQIMLPKMKTNLKEECKDYRNIAQRKGILSVSNDDDSSIIGIVELSLTCMIGDRGASCIACGILQNTTLRILSLPNCNIHTAGLGAIFKAVSGNTSLRTLCVRANYYDPGVDDNLAKMLDSNRTLVNLDIGSCSMGNLSDNIVQALCLNSTLSSLILERNRLGDAGVAALSQVFAHPRRLSSITMLDLSYNQASAKSLSVLASSLQHIKPRKLDELNLTGNLLDPSAHDVISSLKASAVNLTAGKLDHETLFADFISQM